jgi:hypothetical protein
MVNPRRQSTDSARNNGLTLALSIVGGIRFHLNRRDADVQVPAVTAAESRALR